MFALQGPNIVASRQSFGFETLLLLCCCCGPRSSLRGVRTSDNVAAISGTVCLKDTGRHRERERETKETNVPLKLPLAKRCLTLISCMTAGLLLLFSDFMFLNTLRRLDTGSREHPFTLLLVFGFICLSILAAVAILAS